MEVKQCFRFSKKGLLRDVSSHAGAENQTSVLWTWSQCSKSLSLLQSQFCLSAYLINTLIRQWPWNISMNRQSCPVGKTLKSNGDRSDTGEQLSQSGKFSTSALRFQHKCSRKLFANFKYLFYLIRHSLPQNNSICV